MQLIIVVEIMAVLAAAFIYAILKPEDRANMWRKIQCYSAARAEGITTYSNLYTQYKREMGVN